MTCAIGNMVEIMSLLATRLDTNEARLVAATVVAEGFEAHEQGSFDS